MVILQLHLSQYEQPPIQQEKERDKKERGLNNQNKQLVQITNESNDTKWGMKNKRKEKTEKLVHDSGINNKFTKEKSKPTKKISRPEVHSRTETQDARLHMKIPGQNPRGGAC